MLAHRRPRAGAIDRGFLCAYAQVDRPVEARSISDRGRILIWIRDRLADGRRVLLMSDYDGTLSPIVKEPAQVLRARVGIADPSTGGCDGPEVDGPDLAFSHPEAEAHQESLRMISLALTQPVRADCRFEDVATAHALLAELAEVKGAA